MEKLSDQDIEIINHFLKKVHEKINVPFSPVTWDDVPDGEHIDAARFVKLDRELTEADLIHMYQDFDYLLSEYFEYPDTIVSPTEKEGVYHYQYSFRF